MSANKLRLVILGDNVNEKLYGSIVIDLSEE